MVEMPRPPAAGYRQSDAYQPGRALACEADPLYFVWKNLASHLVLRIRPLERKIPRAPQGRKQIQARYVELGQSKHGHSGGRFRGVWRWSLRCCRHPVLEPFLGQRELPLSKSRSFARGPHWSSRVARLSRSLPYILFHRARRSANCSARPGGTLAPGSLHFGLGAPAVENRDGRCGCQWFASASFSLRWLHPLLP